MSRRASTRKSVVAANLDIPFGNMSIGRESVNGTGRPSVQGRPSVRLSMAPSGRLSMSAYAVKDTRPIKDKRFAFSHDDELDCFCYSFEFWIV
jgi:hypothetical protein